MREVLTVPTYATNCLTGAVMFPVLLVVAAIGIGRETDGIALSEVVAQLVPGSRELLILCLMFQINLLQEWRK